MRHALLLSVLSLIACGDKLGTGTFPQIGVNVDSQSFSTDGTAYFGQALQRDIVLNVRINNNGTGDLKISGIDWDVDKATGAQKKNPYVRLDFRGVLDANSFPYTIDSTNRGAVVIGVVYTPPLGKPLDDFSDSVLLIKSNARGLDGRSSNKELRITFSMRQDIAVPLVTPTNYVFTNATAARPETHEFQIYNDAQLATAPFRVLGVRLESPSTEFTLHNVPSSGTVVLEPSNPGYVPAKFSVTYQPSDDTPDTNAILIDTDVNNGTLRVPLSTNTNLGSYSLSYSHVDEFDFTNVNTRTMRSVQITSEGPGPITIREPRIEPAEARGTYSLKAFLPATTPEGTDTEITLGSRGLLMGRSIRLEVTFQPTNNGNDSANGELIVPYENPNPGEIVMALFSGQPKSKIGLAPATGNVVATGVRLDGEDGTRKVVVYNDGNGPLQVTGGQILSAFGGVPPVVWELAQPFQAFTVAPGGLKVLEVAYDLGALPATGKASEYLELTYFNDFTGESTTISMGLQAEDLGSKTNPTANAGTYSGVVAGQTVTLSGAASTAGTGTIEANNYAWYLTSKPAGSMARLNEQGRVSVPFVPDVPGSYTIELVVFASDGSSFYFSEPASVTLTVSAP